MLPENLPAHYRGGGKMITDWSDVEKIANQSTGATQGDSYGVQINGQFIYNPDFTMLPPFGLTEWVGTPSWNGL